MKKALFLFAFLVIFAGIQAQSFFKPMPKNAFKGGRAASGLWAFRPALVVTAVELTWDKTEKVINSKALSSFGAGVSYSHFVESNGEPFNNYSVSGLVLLGSDVTSITPASVSFAGTFSFSILNAGFGYNFGEKKLFALTGVKFSF